jgi:hypothetical protein
MRRQCQIVLLKSIGRHTAISVSKRWAKKNLLLSDNFSGKRREFRHYDLQLIVCPYSIAISSKTGEILNKKMNLASQSLPEI